MNTFVIALLLALTVSLTACATPVPQASQKVPPTKLAHYQLGAYLAANGTQLRVNVDKQLGGQVFVQLVGHQGKLYVDRIMNPLETTARLRIDLTDLTDGDYLLKVSNGLEVEVREIKITTTKPIVPARSLTVL